MSPMFHHERPVMAVLQYAVEETIRQQVAGKDTQAAGNIDRVRSAGQHYNKANFFVGHFDDFHIVHRWRELGRDDALVARSVEPPLFRRPRPRLCPSLTELEQLELFNGIADLAKIENRVPRLATELTLI
jgi:hypothetical protein